MEGRGEQHRGGNVDLGSEPHRAWIVDRLQFVTEQYRLLRLQEHDPSAELESKQGLNDGRLRVTQSSPHSRFRSATCSSGPGSPDRLVNKSIISRPRSQV